MIKQFNNFFITCFYIILFLFIVGYPTQFISIFNIPIIFLLISLIPLLFFIKFIRNDYKLEIISIIILINILFVFLFHLNDFNKVISFRDSSHYLSMLFYIVGYYLLNKDGLSCLENTKFNYAVSCIVGLQLFLFFIYLFYGNPEITLNSKKIKLFFITTFFGSLVLFLHLKLFKQIFFKEEFSYFKIIVLYFMIFIFVFIMQSRTEYIYIILIYALLVAYDKKILLIIPPLIITMIISLFMLSILDVNSRLNFEFNISNYYNHFLTTFGMYSYGFEGQLAGISQRFNWWSDNFDQSINNLEYLFIGRGFGFPLTEDFVRGENAIREVHNSFLSVFFRMGIFGIIFLISIWIFLFVNCIKAFILIWKKSLYSFFYFFFILVSINILLNSIAQDTFEKIYYAIPFYFIFGVAKRIIDYEYSNNS